MAMFKIFKKSTKMPASLVSKPKPAPKAKKAVQKKVVTKKAPPKKAEIKKSPAKKVEYSKPSVKNSVPKQAFFNKMSDEKAYELLKRYRVQVPESAFCKTEDDVREALKKIGFPCAMKVSGNVLHKTNVSGVKLNISTEDEALSSFRELIKIKGTDKILVQKMIREGYELIVGGKKDPQFKSVVALGAGGILTEVMKDVSFRIAPLSRQDAEEMLREVKFSDLIMKGFRGQKPADANAIIDVILAVSKMLESNPQIKELDINPLFASSSGAVAADVRIVLE